ncbi:MAG: PhoPQ-activated protein PqaA family protein, partial [Armatimonadota bacterium]|nr:PhoPQ-activated protein PqaA family protein [Armatimonadota bacterium]
MKRFYGALLCAALLLALVAGFASTLQAQTNGAHPLLEYVARPDDAFRWEKAEELTFPGQGTLVRLNMTSQVWQGIPWKHEVSLIRPEKPRSPETALLLITGGNPKTDTLLQLAGVASRAGMPVAVLWNIPNQPLFGNLREDALISHTFVEFLKTKDKTWPLLYPMTKSAVRAMDALQAVAQQQWQSPIKGFVVTGASKRGWTTWFTGAVDPRVVGIAPMVYDNLNLKAQMEQQLAMYGTYSAQITDYTTKGLPQLLSSPEGQELARIVDPYALRHRLTMPKLIVNGSNDPYWTLESANLYFYDVPGDNRILYVPNAGHGLDQEGTFGS